MDSASEMDPLVEQMRKRLERASALREANDVLDPETEEVVALLRKQHGQAFLFLSVAPHLARAMDEGDIETTRSLLRLIYDIEVEGRGWDELREFLRAERLAAEMTTETLGDMLDRE